MKILLAVDGSKNALQAVKTLVEHADWYRERPQVELVTVHLPVPRIRNVNKAQVERYYREEAEQRVDAACKQLERANIRYELRMLIGQPAEEIVKHASKTGCDLIYIGAPQAMIGSTTTKVMDLSEVPVLLGK